jgi:multicomponent K+:H+ antiporter subunit E
MKRRLLPSIPLSITVFLFWLLMGEDYGPGSVVMGLLLAWLMPLLASRQRAEGADGIARYA